MTSIILCTFPGIGKTSACWDKTHNYLITDLEIELFDNAAPDFPEQYAGALDSFVGYWGEPDFVCMTWDAATVEQLHKKGYKYYNVLPDAGREGRYTENLKDCRSPEGDLYSEVLPDAFEYTHADMLNDTNSEMNFILPEGEYLSHKLNEIHSYHTGGKTTGKDVN